LKLFAGRQEGQPDCENLLKLLPKGTRGSRANAELPRRSKRKPIKLDTGQSPTLARPAAPLAAGVAIISSVDKINKSWLPWQRSLWDKN